MNSLPYSEDFVEVCASVQSGLAGRIGLGAGTCAVIGALSSWWVASIIFACWCLGSVWEAFAFKRFATRLNSRIAEAHMLIAVFANMAVTAAPIVVCIAEKELGLAIAAGFYASATTLFLIILFGRYRSLLIAAVTPCAIAVLIATVVLAFYYFQRDDLFLAVAMFFLPICYGLIGLLPHLTLRHRDRQLETLVAEALAQQELAEEQKEEAEQQRREAQKAKRDADDANAAKSDFLASMSHEIRTPMNGIIGMNELMMQSGLTEAQKQFSRIIQTSGENLLVIINDILDFAKLEAREVELHLEWFSLSELVQTVATLVSAKTKPNKVRIEYWIDPSIPDMLFADAVRLRQVLTNLARNSVKFTDQGYIRLIVKPSRKASDVAQTCLSFSVEDTGIGIKPEKISTMFEKFSQADTGTTRTYGGTGLGLAICKELVTLLSGNISATSQPGVGSTFTFDVPLATVDTAGVAQNPQPATRPIPQILARQ
ncbi:MAG: ATP-binding protein [Litorimonas sp.]